MTTEKGDRVSTERRLGGLAHRDLSVEQATFSATPLSGATESQPRLQRKYPHRRSRSERERERDGRPWTLFGSCWASYRWAANSSNLIGGHSKLTSANPIFGPARVDPRAAIPPKGQNSGTSFTTVTSELAATRWVTRPRSETSNHGQI